MTEKPKTKRLNREQFRKQLEVQRRADEIRQQQLAKQLSESIDADEREQSKETDQ